MKLKNAALIILLFSSFGITIPVAAQTGNAPRPREEHTAIWTGSDMIVWGGFGGGNAANTNAPDNDGGIYHFSANSWSSPPLVGAPGGRYYHSAIWTGSEMIIWGGGNYDNSFNFYASGTGGRYNPLLNSWTGVTNTGAPSARASHSAVWTSAQMIIWGGADDNGAFNSGAAYDPAANKWTPMSSANAPTARWYHTAVWTGNDMIIWGGYSGFFDLSDGKRFNLVSNTWASIPSNGLLPRSYHTAIWTGDKMIVWGGAGGAYHTTLYNNGSRYDPAANTWASTTTSGAPLARNFHTAVWTGTEMIIWGGTSGSTTFNDGGRYNPTTDIWTPVSTLGAPTARGSHTAIWTGNEMLVWGGISGTNYLNDGGRYNPATDTWIALPTNAAPQLSISLTTSNTALLDWAFPAIGHSLEQNNNLVTPDWQTVTNTPAVIGAQNQVILPVTGAKSFYRLK